VCVACHSVAYSASVQGQVTRTSRTLTAPESAARFTGPTLEVHDETVWGAAQADGSRTAQVKLTVAGQPVSLNAQMALAHGGPGSVVTMTGELKAAIPFLGKKIEQGAAPAVLAGFETQQQVGESWLSR
jgi:hypothetical protein